MDMISIVVFWAAERVLVLCPRPFRWFIKAKEYPRAAGMALMVPVPTVPVRLDDQTRS
jgi:hypothetical protein